MTLPSPDQRYRAQLQSVDFQPIFILGDHRSGTTVLYQTLAASGCFNVITAQHIIQYDELLHNHIHGLTDQKLRELQTQFEQLGISDREFDAVPVTPDLPEEYGFILRNVGGYEPHISDESLDTFVEACRKVQFISSPLKPLLLKNPWCYPYFLYIQRAFPQARFIFIHRNPIHVINSKLKAVDTVLSRWNDYTGLISKRYNQIFKSPINRLMYRVMYFKRFNLGVNKTLKQSMVSTRYFLDNIQALPPEAYVSIRFEDFCDRPQPTLEQIFAFLKLTPAVPADYDSLIQQRAVKLLPTVEKNKRRIYQQLAPYFELQGYSI